MLPTTATSLSHATRTKNKLPPPKKVPTKIPHPGTRDRFHTMLLTAQGRSVCSHLQFALTIALMASGYLLSFGCRRCFGEDGPGAVFPTNFWVSSTIQRPPAYGVAVSIVSFLSPCFILLGLERFEQIQTAIKVAQQPNLHHLNRRSMPLLYLFAIFLFMTIFVPVHHLKWHVMFESIAFSAAAAYGSIQISGIESKLIAAGVVRRNKKCRTLFEWAQRMLLISASTFFPTGVTGVVPRGTVVDVVMRVISVIAECLFLALGSAVFAFGDFANVKIIYKASINGNKGNKVHS